MFSALTGQPVHIVNARSRRLKPGLRPQHVQVVKAIGELVNARSEGVVPDSKELVFRPGKRNRRQDYLWDIGTAGSTTMLALAVLPALAFSPVPVKVELRGGLFQDFAPSVFHLQHVMIPLLRRMGLQAEVIMDRPGYAPSGNGLLRVIVSRVGGRLRSLTAEEGGASDRIWGIALASHLAERHVSERMAEAAHDLLVKAGYRADIQIRQDQSALQRGAALTLFADLAHGTRLGADQAGAPRRRAESIGRHVAGQLLEDLHTGATLDRFAADQIVPFAALAKGTSRFRLPAITDHVVTNVWLAEMFLNAEIHLEDTMLSIEGVGFQPNDDDD